MTIHAEHPFADPDADPVRRLRGRLGGAVTLWTSGDVGALGAGGAAPAGLTVSSVMVARGEPGAVLGLVDPESDLRDALERTGRGVVHLLQWRHRDLAEVFAGLLPAPGGAFAQAGWHQGSHGPLLDPAPTHALVEVDDVRAVGWSDLVQARVVAVEVADDGEPLEHRRGRYQRGPSTPRA